MDNEDRIRVFEDTQRAWERNELLSKAVGDSILYQARYDSEVYTPIRKKWLCTRVTMENKRTFACARMFAQTHVAVLNFADYYVPGGRVKQGAGSQEECLCRVSTLYPCISTQTHAWYDKHAGNMSPYYSDDAIYTPGVVVFKDDYELRQMSFDDWFKCDVITCAAPNNENHDLDSARLRKVFAQRWRHIIRIAIDRDVDTLVLGAFGCGVFGNDPTMVAETACEAITEYAGAIGRIVFAIPAGPNYDAFAKVFDRTYFEAVE